MFAAGIYLSIVAPLTILANCLMLYVLLKSQLKASKTPVTGFLIGLALADITTALVSAPCLIYCYLQLNLKGIQHDETREFCNRVLFELVRVTAPIPINISFLTILMFTFVQYLALVSPMKIARRVTRKKVIMSQVVIWVYSILFRVPYVTGIMEYELLVEIDVYLNTISIALFSLVLYARLYCVFRRRMANSTRLRTGETRNDVSRVREGRLKNERRFIVINVFLFCIMIVTSAPSIGYWFASMYFNLSDTPDTAATGIIIDCILYSKSFLNPFVYAWRLSKYRTALRELLGCKTSKKPLEHATEMMTASVRTTAANTPAVSLTSIKPLYTT